MNNDNPVQKRFELVQELAAHAWKITDVKKLEELVNMVKVQKDLANRAFWARINAESGQTAISSEQKLTENTAKLKKLAGSIEWLGIED